MQTGIATSAPAATMTTGLRPGAAPAKAVITENATIAPTITTSPCAKLINWMMP